MFGKELLYIENDSRYFIGLSKITNVKRYYLDRPILIMYNFRANSNEGFGVCSNVIRNQIDIYDFKGFSDRLIQKFIF